MFTLFINGKETTLEAEPDMPILWALRDIIGLKGTKFGCGQGLCGACTILVDDKAVRACLTPIEQLHGKSITTIEGLSENGEHPLQQAWVKHNVSQCGYCQAGQIMNATSLLLNNEKPSEQDIKNSMTGNICRCGTYNRIETAISDTIGQDVSPLYTRLGN